MRINDQTCLVYKVVTQWCLLASDPRYEFVRYIYHKPSELLVGWYNVGPQNVRRSWLKHLTKTISMRLIHHYKLWSEIGGLWTPTERHAIEFPGAAHIIVRGRGRSRAVTGCRSACRMRRMSCCGRWTPTMAWLSRSLLKSCLDAWIVPSGNLT